MRFKDYIAGETVLNRNKTGYDGNTFSVHSIAIDRYTRENVVVVRVCHDHSGNARLLMKSGGFWCFTSRPKLLPMGVAANTLPLAIKLACKLIMDEERAKPLTTQKELTEWFAKESRIFPDPTVGL